MAAWVGGSERLRNRQTDGKVPLVRVIVQIFEDHRHMLKRRGYVRHALGILSTPVEQ